MIHTIDLAIVLAYLLGLFGWALYIGRKETAEDFLVFSRRAPFLLVLFSVVSTWVGVGTTVATAASAYEKGISLGITAVAGGTLGVIGAAWFAPRLKQFGDKFSAHTIGDFFLIRYSEAARTTASALILVVYLILTAAQFVGLSSLLSVWTGIEFEVMLWFAAASTIVYTAFAGIKSDFYTDVIHFVVMSVVMFLILLPATITSLNGISVLQQLPISYFDPFAYGGISFFFAGLIFGGGSAFVTMEIWQRIYASATGSIARKALATSVIGIVSFYILSMFLGLAARILLPDLANRDLALFSLMGTYLPAGALGFGIAGFMAIFISTVNSTIMVASATLTKDFYKGIVRPTSTDKEILIVGRVATLFCGLAGIVIASLLPDLVALSVNGLFMLLVLLPAVVGGFFWKRVTSKAAIFSVIVGTMVTIVFLGIDASKAFVPGFVASLALLIGISFCTRNSATENLNVVRGWRQPAEDSKRSSEKTT